jgi:hypothetical protein
MDKRTTLPVYRQDKGRIPDVKRTYGDRSAVKRNDLGRTLCTLGDLAGLMKEYGGRPRRLYVKAGGEKLFERAVCTHAISDWACYCSLSVVRAKAWSYLMESVYLLRYWNGLLCTPALGYALWCTVDKGSGAVSVLVAAEYEGHGLRFHSRGSTQGLRQPRPALAGDYVAVDLASLAPYLADLAADLYDAVSWAEQYLDTDSR